MQEDLANLCLCHDSYGARKRTRTSTPLREPGPEPGASASSAIRALFGFYLVRVAFRNECQSAHKLGGPIVLL